MASVMPLLRAEAVCDAIQYWQLLVTLTATYSSSFVSGSSAPGAITCLMPSQVRFSVAGSCAIAFQKLLIQSVFRVAMMSSYTARTSGLASLYSISGNVGMRSPNVRVELTIQTSRNSLYHAKTARAHGGGVRELS